MYETTKLKCHCGRLMAADGRLGRGAFRCGCGRDPIHVVEHPSPARHCSFGTCRTLATTREPLRFCPEHEAEAAALLARVAGSAKLRELEDLLPKSRSTWVRRYGYKMSPLPSTTDQASVVYFARRERLIKIGTTVQLRQRMHSLATCLLATEPGELVRENQLKRQFSHLLAVGREWFHPGPDLIAYINGLREAEGLKGISA
ncbi:hypothetical protein AB0E04_03835 [Streptomyces sp. NPDC048251]|uniref:hypothetical protein n=1 Tax=Streptomyces sp. NPDC048251 TaxID=3154501 RepID=UPI0034255841